MANKYTLVIQQSAKKQLKKLPADVSISLKNAIDSLTENPRPHGCKKLSTGEYRVRQGNYRIIYEIFDKELVIKVIEVVHRRDAYR